MIKVSLNEIRAQSPCESGWIKVMKSKGGSAADMDAQFPLADIIESNDLDDALWALRCRPEYSNLWRKFAIWAARQVESQLTDERSRNALDVAWRHSDGLATNAELAAARAASAAAWAAASAAASDAASAAASAAARAAASAAASDAASAAASAAAWAASDAARDVQKAKLLEILTAEEWVN